MIQSWYLVVQQNPPTFQLWDIQALRYSGVLTYSRHSRARNNYLLTEAQFYQIMDWLLDMSTLSKKRKSLQSSTHSCSCFDRQVFILSQLASEKRSVVKGVMPRVSGGPVTCWMLPHIVWDTHLPYVFKCQARAPHPADADRGGWEVVALLRIETEWLFWDLR